MQPQLLPPLEPKCPHNDATGPREGGSVFFISFAFMTVVIIALFFYFALFHFFYIFVLCACAKGDKWGPGSQVESKEYESRREKSLGHRGGGAKIVCEW